tara:strand:+ start:655 stop:1722 length:1068 start_codon:yes stop_codon:yes gene_type:complete
MIPDIHSKNKAIIAEFRSALYDYEPSKVLQSISKTFHEDAKINLGFPFSNIDKPTLLYEEAYQPLYMALHDLERRDYIVIAAPSEHVDNWVGCAGFYTGKFSEPWLDIPPTGHQVSMRFHEFYRIEDNAVIEMQAIWDIPELMMQANVWPMAPSLGREWLVPGPATQDGITDEPYDAERSELSKQYIIDMLESMQKHPSMGGPEVMQMEKFWHPSVSWYGPAGIGTCRGIEGFRNWHQIPFLKAMPDRGKYRDQITYHFFAERNFVAVTGWPNMAQTLTHDGWMGIAPVEKKITLRSLDFWRIENGLIRENWVMVDLLDVYNQIGVDVFSRLREFNKSMYSTNFKVTPDGELLND